MSTQIQFRRGTSTQNDAFTGALGEVVVDTTNKVLRVHDGSTAGGFAAVGLSASQSITNKSYSGNIISLSGNATVQALTVNASATIATTLSVAGALTLNSTNGVTAIINGGTTGTGNIGATGAAFNTVFAKATTAQYADLAEKYSSDATYTPGQVLVFGGSSEVTISVTDMPTSVAGVVTTNPAYLMNSELTGETSTIALQGRVPCMVVGTVTKGDLLVATYDGKARAEQNPKVGTVIGKSLENFDGGEGVIEVAVGRF